MCNQIRARIAPVHGHICQHRYKYYSGFGVGSYLLHHITGIVFFHECGAVFLCAILEHSFTESWKGGA